MEYAISCLDALRNQQKSSISASKVISSSSRNNTNRNGDDDRKIAHNIAQRFRKEEWFNRKLGEAINKYLKNYSEAALDYNISQSVKYIYFHNRFDGEAKRFYRDMVRPGCDRYPWDASKMVAEYNIVTCQNRVRQYLQGIRFESFSKEESCDTSEGLEKIRNIIIRFSPQGPKYYRSEEAKVAYLYNAVSAFSWSKHAFNQCYEKDPLWKCQQLYTELDSAWIQ